MRKLLAGLFAAGLLLSAAPALEAGQGARPELTTFRELAKNADVVIKAKLVEIVDVKLTEADGANTDVMMNRDNNPDESIRRDAKLEVTDILRGAEGVSLGELQIVSMQQCAFSQYPEALQKGEEGIFFLAKRPFDGRWAVGGSMRGILTSEDAAGDFARVERAVRDVMQLEHQYVLNEDFLLGNLQERMLKEVKLDGSRVGMDALLELTWNGETYAPYFDTYERFKLLDLVQASDAGSDERLELITLTGRVKPAGGEWVLVETVVADPSSRVAARAADALEQYGTATSCEILLDRYMELTAEQTTARARVINTLGILRPYAKHANEIAVRARFTDLLRSVINRDSDDEVLEEALLAARDMRYGHNELGSELMQLVQDYRDGLVGEVVMKRAIVALAATRNAKAKEFLLSIDDDFDGRFTKHIQLCLSTPFTVLVEMK